VARSDCWGSGGAGAPAHRQPRAPHQHGDLHPPSGGRPEHPVRSQKPALWVVVQTVRVAVWGRVPDVHQLAADTVSCFHQENLFVCFFCGNPCGSSRRLTVCGSSRRLIVWCRSSYQCFGWLRPFGQICELSDVVISSFMVYSPADHGCKQAKQT
jgi:hypothetical protein